MADFNRKQFCIPTNVFIMESDFQEDFCETTLKYVFPLE